MSEHPPADILSSTEVKEPILEDEEPAEQAEHADDAERAVGDDEEDDDDYEEEDDDAEEDGGELEAVDDEEEEDADGADQRNGSKNLTALLLGNPNDAEEEDEEDEDEGEDDEYEGDTAPATGSKKRNFDEVAEGESEQDAKKVKA